MYSPVGWFYMDYSIVAAARKRSACGSAEVLKRPGCFNASLQLICIVGSDVCYPLPPDYTLLILSGSMLASPA